MPPDVHPFLPWWSTWQRAEWAYGGPPGVLGPPHVSTRDDRSAPSARRATADRGHLDAARGVGSGMATGRRSGDRVLDERRFELGGGIDLSTFLDDAAVAEATGGTPPADTPAPTATPSTDEPADAAIGRLHEPFVAADTVQAGDVAHDGTVAAPPEQDSVTDLAVHGEQRLHWSLMVAMVVTYSLVGFLVGAVLPDRLGTSGPWVATGLLSGMAVFGFWLGERWIPRPSMHILGVTWVIISMKLLYGLALDLHHWGWLGGGEVAGWWLGGILLGLVGANTWAAHHHDNDAIAAQATLVLLAIASAAGGLAGELGVAALIALATLMLHALALMRRSGNLASLGIVSTNLWIGMHALADDWSISALAIVGFDDPDLLLLLMLAVNAANAAMAARFAKEQNWFSDGARVVGLGRPGLWGVSVGIGLVGALLAVSAHRLDTGYALAQVTTLLAVFGASYLTVRGEPGSVVAAPLGAAVPGLLFVLWPEGAQGDVLGRALAPVLASVVAGLGYAGLHVWSRGWLRAEDPRPAVVRHLPALIPLLVGVLVLVLEPDGGGYALWAAIAASATAVLLLEHQAAVSDQVLWIGSIALMVLLTLLIQAEDTDGVRVLLGSLAAVHVGTAWLAVRRGAPSLAGVAVLSPWVWVILFGPQATRILPEGWVPIAADGWELTLYMLAAVIIQLPVNLKLGDSGVNLAARLAGLSEAAVHLRDSGLLVLWNLGLVVSLIGFLATSLLLPGAGLLLGVAVLFAIHAGVQVAGVRSKEPNVVVWATASTVLVLTFRHGMVAWWATLAVVSLGVLHVAGRATRSERVLAVAMGTIAGLGILWLVFEPSRPLEVLAWSTDRSVQGWALLLSVAAMLAIYLPRASTFLELLLPAGAAVGLLGVSVLIGLEDEVAWGAPFALLLFVASGAWLAAQGEIRSGLASVARREQRVERIELKQRLASFVAEGGDVTALEVEFDSARAAVGASADVAPALVQAPSGVTTAAAPVQVTAAASPQAPLAATDSAPALEDAVARIPGTALEPAPPPVPAAGPLRAGSEATPTLRMSVSTPGLQLIDPELIALLEKQRKRSRRRGTTTPGDLLVGDIHHRPVVVLSFLTGTLLWAVGWVFLDQPGAAGMILASGLVCCLFIFLARWRASTLELSLPDLFGVEIPIGWTMMGLGLAVVAGRLNAGAVDTADASDILVLVALLTVLGAISLTGRRDLALRVPSTVFWLVGTLVGVRLLAVVLGGGALPSPLMLDPWRPAELLWILPWIIAEIMLALYILAMDGIEGVRLRGGMDDMLGAGRRGMFPMAVVSVSWGPAALLAGLLGLRRGRAWQQPAAVGFCFAVLLLAWSAIALAWWPEARDWLGHVMLGAGGVTAAAIVWSLLEDARTPWTSIWAWNLQVFLPLGALFLPDPLRAPLVIALLAVSLTIWVTGTLQARRSLRVWGAANLAVAWLVGLLGVTTYGFDALSALIMLAATAVVLGIITWLNQRHEPILMEG